MSSHIAQFRARYRLKAEDLGRMVGVSKMTIYRWERGATKPHGNHYEKLEKIMRSYQMIRHGRT